MQVSRIAENLAKQCTPLGVLYDAKKLSSIHAHKLCSTEWNRTYSAFYDVKLGR